MSVVEVKKLNKIYGEKNKTNVIKALNGITMSINKGEFVSIMGPSGSGKTTLLNILGGLDQPTDGLIEIDGTPIAQYTKDELALFRNQKIGFVFQDFNLLDSLTIKENIILPLVLNNNKLTTAMEEKVDDLMKYLDIDNIANKYPNTVSGGQQQRAVIARALIKDPIIVLADEPTGNLDSSSSKKTMELFKNINNHFSSTILMVTHDPLAASFSDRIIFIKDGCEFAELVREDNRKAFFDKIINYLALLEGDQNEL